MKRRTLAAVFVGLLALSAYAKFAWKADEEQFAEATQVVVAKSLKRHDVKISEHVAYAAFEFEVTEEIKGSVRGMRDGEGAPKRIVVMAQTVHDWACPSGPAFEAGKEFVLFLKGTETNYLYTMVTDWQGDIAATREKVEAVRKLVK